MPIDGQRLTLHTAHGAQHQHGTIQHPQAAFDFDGKIHMSRCVDDVHLVAVPMHGRGSRGNGNPPLPLQLHEVHRGTAVTALDFLDTVNASGIEQDPLGKSRFARVDMGGDSDVSNCVDARHDPSPKVDSQLSNAMVMKPISPPKNKLTNRIVQAEFRDDREPSFRIDSSQHAHAHTTGVPCMKNTG